MFGRRANLVNDLDPFCWIVERSDVRDHKAGGWMLPESQYGLCRRWETGKQARLIRPDEDTYYYNSKCDLPVRDVSTEFTPVKDLISRKNYETVWMLSLIHI